MANNPPVDVQKYGQSIWYDNISRQLLVSGEIQRLVDEDGVMGMTSNPTIFEQAISRSDIYDAAIASLLDADATTIFEHLAIEDIQAAADILRPIYDRTNGVDGYISLEVSPTIAHDAEKTISEAVRLRDAVDRPNLMIKIPATDAGLHAIEESIFNGVNVNVTLIFSLDYYAKVIEAYLRGLERRADAGLPLDTIASVASFFLSRIDVMVDQQLESNILRAQGHDIDRVAANRRLLGKAAIANAKMAYKLFKEQFNTERFAKLRDAGARVQRPLWASTSTKNPAYPDTMYVDNLIGPNTVNTVPPSTLAAFKDHGTVAPTLEEGLDEAADVLDMLAEVGVNLEMVTNALLEDGVEKFVHSYQTLMSVIEGKRKMLKAGVIQRQKAALGAYRLGVEETLEELKDASEQIWGRNAEWWREEHHHRENISNRLGWLDVLDGRIDYQRLQALQETAKQFEHVVLLGMGGSSLAPEVLSLTFGQQSGFPKLLMLDSTVPASVLAIENAIEFDKTVFVVASKSGTTIETNSFYDYFYAKATEKLGEKAGQHFIIITDPETVLIEVGQQRGVRDIFENPPDIGGRYSALSYFGLVPAALLGLDLGRLMNSATRMKMAIDQEVPYKNNPALQLGAIIGHIGKAGRDKLTILTSPQISSFGNWIEQLVAESTGKLGVGIVPVVGATFGLPHDYDDDRLIIYLRLDDDPTVAETDEKIQLLQEAGHPVVTIQLQDAYELGGEFLRWEFATAVVGKILNINPFDEPDVASAKSITKTLLNQYVEEGALPTETPLFSEDGVSLYADKRIGTVLQDIAVQRHFNVDNSDQVNLEALLAAHISLARSGYYIALLSYTAMTEAIDDKLQTIRRRLRHTTKRAVTLGYGPRYLHSTGQLHKGGPNIGVFLLITVDDEQDAAIPDKPYTFSILKQAQQLGDLQALRDAKRHVVRLHITGDILAGLDKISRAIEAAEAKII